LVQPDRESPSSTADAAAAAHAGPRPSSRVESQPLPNWVELLVQVGIAYSIATYFIEIQLIGSDNSRQGPPFFLWSERTVAALFTVEYLVRWWRSNDLRRYPFTALAMIDALAIVPFYVGFVVDLRMLRLVRTLRMLRLLKLYRYNAALQSLASSFSKVGYHLRVVGVVVLMFVLFSSTAIFECERRAQPEVFAHFTDGVWWSITTLTTVGYGDKFPITAAGRVIASVTVVFGLGVFGTFVSLIGGAFVSTLKDAETGRHVVHLAAPIHEEACALLRARGDKPDADAVDALVEEAVRGYVAAGRRSSAPAPTGAPEERRALEVPAS
jgi:voltage-gated potassium channel